MEADTGDVDAPVDLPLELQPQIDVRIDRVRTTRLQTFIGTAADVHYDAALSTGSIQVVGRASASGIESNLRPLVLRRAVIVAATITTLFASLTCYGRYVGRHVYFQQYGLGGWVAIASLIAAFAITWLVATFLLPRRARAGPRTLAPVVMTALSLVTTTAIFIVSGPTLKDARAAIARGDTARAEIEASAVSELHIDDAGGKAILDDLHLARVRQASEHKRMADLVKESWFSSAKRAIALGVVDDASKSAANSAYARGDAGELDRIAQSLDGLDDDLAATERSRASLLRGETCARAEDVPCALESLNHQPRAAPGPELDRARKAVIDAITLGLGKAVNEADGERNASYRVGVLQRAVFLSGSYTDLVSRPSTPPLEELQTRLAKAQTDAAAAAALEEGRRKKEQARRKAEEAAREAQEHEATRSLLCCDGTESPSCLCHAPSHGGCCSHHHGVCGCAP